MASVGPHEFPNWVRVSGIILLMIPAASVSHHAVEYVLNDESHVVGNAREVKPNIVWVMADDLGYGEVGVYPSSSPHGDIQTPHMDRFSSEGISFMHAYAGYSVCAPSRMAFFTGRHSGNFYKLSNANVPDEEWFLRTGEPGVTTIPMLLKGAGYVTGAFGKASPLEAPLQQGFDVYIGQLNEVQCHNMYPKAIDQGGGSYNLRLVGNEQGGLSRKLCMSHPEQYNYTVDVFHDSAISWLREVASGPSPFFLYLSYTIPHAGGYDEASVMAQPVPRDAIYNQKSGAWPEVEVDHAAVVSYLDEKIGDLMSVIESAGIDGDTLVIIASDNGAHEAGGHKHDFFDSSGGLRGWKRSLFEGGVRSPTMARWPGKIPAGHVSNYQWAFWDVLPTVADLAGITDFPKTDGVSILPTLMGKSQKPKEYIYFTWGSDKYPGYTIRMGMWKGVAICGDNKEYWPAEDDYMELYDLTADPFEQQAVANKPDIIQGMKKFVVESGFTCNCFKCRDPWTFLEEQKMAGLSPEQILRAEFPSGSYSSRTDAVALNINLETQGGAHRSVPAGITRRHLRSRSGLRNASARAMRD